MKPVSEQDFHVLSKPPGTTDQRESFVLQLATALHRFGTPAHRLEQTMDQVMNRIGLQGEVFALPTSLFASFGRPEQHRTSMIRGESGEVNLEKLSLLDRLADDVIQGRVSPGEAYSRLNQILAQPNRFGFGMGIIGTALGTGVAGIALRGGWREILIAVVIGVVLGLVTPIFAREPRRRVYDFAAAVSASVIAVVGSTFFHPLSAFTSTLAGLIMLVPGMRLTTAMTEIASGHLVSGAARLTGAVLAFLSIAFGTAIGTGIAIGLLDIPLPLLPPDPLPNIWSWILIALFPVSMLILMQGHPRDLGLISLSTVLAYVGTRAGTDWLGPELGAFVGALLLGVGANAVARKLRRPAALMIAPGLILLVPGSIGYRSLASLLQNDVITGIALGFNVALVGVAIVTGLLMANALLPPQRSL